MMLTSIDVIAEIEESLKMGLLCTETLSAGGSVGNAW